MHDVERGKKSGKLYFLQVTKFFPDFFFTWQRIYHDFFFQLLLLLLLLFPICNIYYYPVFFMYFIYRDGAKQL